MIWNSNIKVRTLIGQCPIICSIKVITNGNVFVQGKARSQEADGGVILKHKALGKNGMFIPEEQMKLSLVELCLVIDTEERPKQGRELPAKSQNGKKRKQ